jgi:hypothetical protein
MKFIFHLGMALVLILAAATAVAQSNLTDRAAHPLPLGGEGQGEGVPSATLQHEQKVRAACIEGRRLICGRILEILPEGLLVESGYTNLLREPLSKSWLIPGTAQASKAEYLIESKTPGAICVGRVLLTDTPKTKKAKPARYDYVNVEAYPAGEFVYRSVGTVQRTVRKFSASLVPAVHATLDAEQKAH